MTAPNPQKLKCIVAFRYLAVCLLFLIKADIAAAQTSLQDSGPVTATHDRQIIEYLRISANGSHGIECRDAANVVIRNVEIFHKGGRGITVVNCEGLTITNASVSHTGTTTGAPWEATGGHNNIEIERSDNAFVSNVRVRGGASGVYILDSQAPHLSFIEGYDMRGPFPRGQLVQFNKSPNCLLKDFSVINDPQKSWPEDNVNVFGSPNCTIRRGLVDGNTSPSGVGVLFENGSTGGYVEEVDAVRMGNGAFTAWGVDNVTFRRTRWRDNICTDQGRGAPSSKGQGWVFAKGAKNGAIINGIWFNKCFSTRWISSDAEATVDIREEDFTPRTPIVNVLPWETSAP